MMSKEIYAQVVSNNKKLRDCVKHNFGAFKPTSGTLYYEKYTCGVCGGSMKIGDISKYIQGYEAAGGNSEDILKGFK